MCASPPCATNASAPGYVAPTSCDGTTGGVSGATGLVKQGVDGNTCIELADGACPNRDNLGGVAGATLYPRTTTP